MNIKIDGGVKLSQKIEKYSMPITESGCWIWMGSLCEGYGKMWCGDKLMLAHRASWIAFKGEIPEGLCVLHRCDTRPCVNPHHLFLGTHKDNTQDMLKKGRMKPGGRIIIDTCTVAGCGNKHTAKGMCMKHYDKHRNPLTGRRSSNAVRL